MFWSVMKDGNAENEIEGGQKFAIPEIESRGDLSGGSEYFGVFCDFWQRRRIIETEYSDTRLWFKKAYRPFDSIVPTVFWGGIVHDVVVTNGKHATTGIL